MALDWGVIDKKMFIFIKSVNMFQNKFTIALRRLGKGEKTET